MRGVPVSPRRVFGVDFSGARDAGRRISVCRAHPGEAGIRIETVDPLAELPGGAVERAAAFRALVQKVKEAPRSAWGFDFPFALPSSLHEELLGKAADKWPGQVEALAALDGPVEFRSLCRRISGGREWRRVTDEEAAAPFCPYNLRMFKQTFYGMTEVLGALQGAAGVAILPLQCLPSAAATPHDARLPANIRSPGGPLPHIYLLEVCPASLLDKLGYSPGLNGYKGRGTDKAEKRGAILRRLTQDGLVRSVTRSLRARIVDDPAGDGLDSVLAAVAVWRGYREYDHVELSNSSGYAVEGHIYT